MHYATLLLQALVGLGFLFLGGSKLVGTRSVAAQFQTLRLGRLVRWAIGLLETLGGLGMLAAMAQPFLAFFVSAFLLLIVLATGVLYALRAGKAVSTGTGLLVMGTLAIAALQPLGLKVLLLPKAQAFPLDAVASARSIKAYEEGLWLEGVAAGPDGTLYLSGNKGENYVTGDKSQVHARIIARAPNGGESDFFQLPQGSTAGVIAFDASGRMYMTGQGEQLGVWRLSGQGKGELFAKLPEGAWPNGLTAGPDAQLYVADAALGVIWRINPETGASSRAIEADALRARPFIALAPGANGLEFFGRDLYVTVSDAGRVLKFHLNPDGSFGRPAIVAEGIPGDDLAIDQQGNLYITTHPFNTVVRVSQDGKRSLIADASQGVTGATDVSLGVLPGDRDTLYVSTDGGAFSGDSKARGTLVALKLKP